MFLIDDSKMPQKRKHI